VIGVAGMVHAGRLVRTYGLRIPRAECFEKNFHIYACICSITRFITYVFQEKDAAPLRYSRGMVKAVEALVI
jgi:hypothetical protein